MHISKITIGRLYNLGSYEHVRYELTVEVPEGQSPATAMIGMEKLLSALNPKPPGSVNSESTIAHDKRRVEHMKELLAKDPAAFRREHSGAVGTPEEYIARCEASVEEAIKRRAEWEAHARKARKMLEDLGGAANWKDAKLEWDDDDEY